jgi:hypothetical protein
MSEVPFMLRANDVQRHIINIDSRFRDNSETSQLSNFYFSLLSPIKNILRLRITSFEFPNNYYMFTAKRKNISFRVIYINNGQTVGQPIVIEEGSYTACELVTAINDELSDIGINWLSVDFNSITGKFTFTGTQTFGIDTCYNSFTRTTDYGLGYYMGFINGLSKSTLNGTKWTVSSTCPANLAGDSYIFMRLNDYNCVRHTQGGSELQYFAKFLLKDPKNTMAFDDYAGNHIKEIVFTTPQDIQKLHIELVDAYGQHLDLCNTHYSFSIEVLEIKNLSLYNYIRNSLATEYVFTHRG